MENEADMTHKYHKATGSRAIVTIISKPAAHALRGTVLCMVMMISIVGACASDVVLSFGYSSCFAKNCAAFGRLQ
jgi:hypothetical protein